MWAVTIVDGGLQWKQQADPVAGDHEIVVAVRAAGLNAADRLQQLGLYPAPAGVPADIPGLELAGEVVAVGARTSRFGIGDRVMAVVGGGGQAEMAAVDERCALAVPDGLPWEEAGGFPEVFSTAYDALFSQCGLAMGERVLVTAAAGGVGTGGCSWRPRPGPRWWRRCGRPSGGRRSWLWGRRRPWRPRRRWRWGRSMWRWSWWGGRVCPVC